MSVVKGMALVAVETAAVAQADAGSTQTRPQRVPQRRLPGAGSFTEPVLAGTGPGRAVSVV